MKNLRRNHGPGYATPEDFCNAFQETVGGLYQLALLLTGDHLKAEECFLGGLQDSIEGNGVFKNWAHAWARRAIVKNAIRALEPRAAADFSAAQSSRCAHRSESQSISTELQSARIEVSQLLALDDFERVVFVLSVLERYPDPECALLLGCSDRQIRQARVTGLAIQRGFSRERIDQSALQVSCGELLALVDPE
jgi:DNA-directed RNA polymerase specialized sigma24 family protein